MLRVFKQYYPIRNIFFVLGEGLFIYISVLIASRIILGDDLFVLSWFLVARIFLITFVCQACLYCNDLYDFKITDSFSELGIRLLQALGAAAIFLAFVYIVVPQAIIGTGTFLISICIVILLIVSWRFCYTLILDRGIFNEKIILLGSSDLANEIQEEIKDKKDCGYTLSVMVPESDDPVDFSDRPTAAIICQKNYENLCNMAHSLDITKIIVALKERRNSLPVKELLQCRVEGIEVIEGHTFFEMLSGKLIVQTINPGWLIFSDGFQKTRTRRFIKRVIDLILSLVLLLIFLPLIIIIGILIKIDSKGPVIFSQERVGEKKKNYRMHKFRSMVEDAERSSGPVWALEDDTRITRVGKIIRRFRFDEIPQLWNVLKGQMSFVGPRPERPVFVKELEKRILRRYRKSQLRSFLHKKHVDPDGSDDRTAHHQDRALRQRRTIRVEGSYRSS
jgi:exopolysaccharide biosynthesis polyprenyl glycosylphosphotransferase